MKEQIISVESQPYFLSKKWWVDVRVRSFGVLMELSVSRERLCDALEIKEGCYA